MLQYGYHVLKYNSRGIGGSTGKPSLDGFAEGQDLKAVVDWATEQIKDIESIIILVESLLNRPKFPTLICQGYSYGSLIATLFPISESIKTSHVLISYPLDARPTLILPFNVKTYDKKLTNLVQNPDGSLLIIFGDRDNFTSIKKYEKWADTLREQAGEDGAELEIVTVPGAAHNWDEEPLEKLVSHLSDWLQEHL